MSSTLFNIYVVGLEQELRKGQAGGIVVGERKVWSLTYAVDIVLMADREEELKEMLKRFKKFLKEAELELSTEKAKIVVFEKKEQKETKKMEMGRAGIRRSGRDKVPGVHTTEKRQR